MRSYNVGMANHSYLSVWLNSMPEDQMLERFGAFLATVPFSASRPGFSPPDYETASTRERALLVMRRRA